MTGTYKWDVLLDLLNGATFKSTTSPAAAPHAAAPQTTTCSVACGYTASIPTQRYQHHGHTTCPRTSPPGFRLSLSLYSLAGAHCLTLECSCPTTHLALGLLNHAQCIVHHLLRQGNEEAGCKLAIAECVVACGVDQDLIQVFHERIWSVVPEAIATQAYMKTSAKGPARAVAAHAAHGGCSQRHAPHVQVDVL